MIRIFLGVLIVSALGTGLYWGWMAPEESSRIADNRAQGIRTVAVETAPVEFLDLVERLYLTGSLEPARHLDVMARVGGRVAQVRVDIGDTVTSGDLLVLLDAEELELEYLQATAELAVSQAQQREALQSVQAALRERDRTMELRRQGIASVAELETAQTQVDLQKSRVDWLESQTRQRAAAVSAAEIRLGHAQVREYWPEDRPRVVVERLVEPGSVMAAQTKVLRLVDLDPLRAVVFVTEREYARLTPGLTVRLRTTAWPEDTFLGTVQRLSPEFRSATRQARVEIEVPNPDEKLRPGMFVELAIDLEQRFGVQTIPRQALLQRAEGRVVFGIDSSKDPPRALLYRVEAGIQDQDRIEIRAPELPEYVVILGQHLLADATPVAIVRENPLVERVERE